MRSYIFQGYVLLALLAFAGLALLANTTPVFGPDVAITQSLQANLPGWFNGIMQAVSWPGYGVQGVTLTALVAGSLAFAGLRWEAIAAMLAGLMSGVINTLIKVAVSRPRPDADLVKVFTELETFSFPSGHVMFYTVFFGFLLFLSFTLLKRSWLRTLLNTLLILLIALVGISRMYLGEHWASDVLGGYILGSLLLAFAIRFYQWGKERFFVRQPVAPAVTGTRVSREEKQEMKEALKNPLLVKKEEVKTEIKEDGKERTNGRHHSNHT